MSESTDFDPRGEGISGVVWARFVLVLGDALLLVPRLLWSALRASARREALRDLLRRTAEHSSSSSPPDPPDAQAHPDHARA